jgi:Tfp pilus assembly protein PilF
MNRSAQLFDEAFALHAAGKIGEALALYQKVVASDPAHAHAWHQLACISAQHNKLAEAEQYFVRAIRLDGGQALFHNNLGDCYGALNRLEAARACFQQAIRLEPNGPLAYVNLSLTLYALDRREEAEQAARTALNLDRVTPEGHQAVATLLLARGEFRQGWAEFEWRSRARGVVRPLLLGASWDGRPLEGQRILIWGEQGLGDVLQFVRYIPQVVTRGGRPVLWAPRNLHPLLEDAGFGELAATEDAPPECEWHCALMSMPHVFATTLETVPAEVPYLRAKPRLTAQWRERLADTPGFRVGICWQGNPNFSRDSTRSVPLVEFAPLAGVGGVRLISLQKFAGLDQLAELSGRFEVTTLGPEYDVEDGAFLNAAAIMQSLDLVIAPDTALAHLAGALGVPVWMALPKMPDWRWMLAGEDSPWYPTMRLFRQTRPGNWSDVFARMAQELAWIVSRK